ncbi:ectonucleotide pyrophosphatase/phosphodiesterase [Olivibacter ginsenosidimutans]|uniref:Ectonucleotide pyrophosphatase/phosphodiesterase n=1 Tax=Olivibacter ginsenosidimutans TaxID=1176537 RepID=A0ABP9B9I0_9SPHI
MKRLFLFLICCLSLLSLHAQQKHVILVTIDGFRPDFYLEDKWPTPNLKQLLLEGIHAYGVNSVFPSVTYSSHTTIVTGVQPDEHGIYYNGVFDPDSAGNKIYWNFHQIKVPTIWETAQKAGLTVASLMWPVSAEAPTSFNIADIGGMGDSVRTKYARPEGVVETIKQEVFHSNADINWGKDQKNAQVAAWVIQNLKPNLMTIHLFSVDHAEHMVGREGSMVSEAISDADSAVGIIRQAIMDAGIADSTLFIVTGDHGFYDVKKSVNPNVWLSKAGLLQKAQFYSAGGSTYLFLRDKKDKQTAKQVMTLLKSLPAEEKSYFRIVSRKEMNKIGADPNVAFALTGLEGAAFGNSRTRETITAGKGGTHGYFPDTRSIQTGFIAISPQMKKGVEIKEMNLRDITVFITEYLHLDMPTVKGKSVANYFNSL